MNQQQMQSRKVKRVQFQDNVNIINDDMSQPHEMNLSKSATLATVATTTSASTTQTTSNDNNAQDHSISSTIDGSMTSEESNNTTEILDCRIEEKIKNELVEKQKMIESGRSSIPNNTTSNNNNNSSSHSGRYDEAPTPPAPPITSSSLMDKQMMSEEESSDEDDMEMEMDMEDPPPDSENDENDELLANEGHATHHRTLLSKRRFYDIRKAPTMLDAKLSELSSDVNNQDKSVFDFKDDDDDVDSEGGRLEINSDFMIRDRKSSTSSSLVKKPYKPKVCLACNTKHGKETCPIRNPISSIPNQIDFSDWVVDHPIIEPPRPLLCDKDMPLEDEKMFFEDSVKSENEMDDDLDDDGEDLDDDGEIDDKMDMNADLSDEITFADVSLPNEFEYLPSCAYQSCNRSVFTKIFIPKVNSLK